MSSIKSIVEFRLEGTPTEFGIMHKLFKDVTGFEPNNIKIGGSVDMTMESKKTKVIVEPSRIAFGCEDFEQIKNKFYFKTHLNKIRESINLDNVAALRVGVRNYFIRTAQNNFEDSRELFRKKFFNEKQLFTSAADLGVVLDYKNAGVASKLVSGPMQKTQLTKMFLDFHPNNSIPSNFFFVDIDAFSTDKINLTDEEIDEVINKLDVEQDKIYKNWLNVFE